MEQTYRRTLMLKCYFNKVAICSLSTRVLSLNFAAYFQYNVFLLKLGFALLLLFCLVCFYFHASKIKYFLTSSTYLTKCITKILNFFILICPNHLIISFGNIVIFFYQLAPCSFHVLHRASPKLYTFFRRPNFDYILHTSCPPHMINAEMSVTALENEM